MDNVVKLSDLAKKMNFKNLTPEIDLETIDVTIADINRPALQLAGFFDHFSYERVQIIGNVEYAYAETMDPEEKYRNFEHIFAHKVPCLIYARSLRPDDTIMEMALRYGVPILSSDGITSDITAELFRWLKVQLAPRISIHGTLLDVFGEGVLITGESGIGKSEAALELVKRGHRLVTDDVVEIRKVSDETLVGSAPDITKHMIELRGIGILDVKAMYGVEAVKDSKAINIVIHLEDFNKDKDYDRMGLKDNYIEYLGNKVVCHDLPVRPGRNIAIIVETAAVNYRQKQMGYNAAQELYDRVQRNIMRGQTEKS